MRRCSNRLSRQFDIFFCLVELSWKQVQAIKAFRGSRAPPGNRKILQCAITTYGNDFGDSQQHGGLEMSWNKKPLDSFWPLYPVSLSYQQVTNLEFQRDGSTRIGRQSQTWLSVLLATLQLKLKTEEIVVWNRFHFVVAFELSPVRNARRVEGDFRSRIHYGVTRVDTGVSKTKCLWISTFAILRVWNLKKHHSKVNVPRGVVSFPSGIDMKQCRKWSHQRRQRQKSKSFGPRRSWHCAEASFCCLGSQKLMAELVVQIWNVLD